MNYDVVKKELAAQPVLVVRKRVKREEIAATIGSVLPGIFHYAQQRGLALSGHPFTRYPQIGPGMVTIFLFQFVSIWNNFFLPYVVLADSNQYPITVGLWDLLSSTPSFNPAVGGGGQSVNIFKPELALATLLAVVPVAIVFLFSQRALVRGLVGGAIKE